VSFKARTAFHVRRLPAPQDNVSKLISSPSDYPKAYICNECIAVCATIIEDERSQLYPSEPQEVERQKEANPLLRHPLASPFLTSVERWIQQESLGADAAEEFAKMRSSAIRMIRAPGE